MSNYIIRVENLGKQYRIGAQQERFRTFRDQFSKSIARAVRSLRNPSASSNSSFDTIWALRNITMDIQPGDVLGVIGRNGAGKSTFLKILAHITDPTEGRVRLRGRVGSLLEVGTGFHPELTGRENIYLNGAILGMHRSEIERKFDEIVDFAEIEKFLDTPVKRYSSGMYIRLAFAVAAHLEPEILLVDEVLSVGDAQFQNKCMGKMSDVAHGGRTVIFVSHNLAAIQRMCTNAILLEKGNMVLQGNVDYVTEKYIDQLQVSSLTWQRSETCEKEAYIDRVDLCDPEGKPVEVVTTSGSLQIAIQYVIRLPVRELQIGVGVMDAAGAQIFGTAPQDSGITPPIQPGSYRAVVKLPPEILLPKPYGLRIYLWTPLRGVMDATESIHFLPVETASLYNSTPQGRPGLLALRCDWELSQIS